MITAATPGQESTTVMMHPDVFDGCTGPWFILHTMSRQEKALAQAMEAMDVPFFLPLRRQVRYHGRQRADVLTPLFPNYIFVRGTPYQVYQADRTKRVANIIQVFDQQRLDSEVRCVHLAISHTGELDIHPFLRKGVRVEVKSGPLQGVRGLIEDRTRDNRLVLQIEMLGQATSIEIDGSLLEPLD
jgi:transcription termination/antitermination protein NusG